MFLRTYTAQVFLARISTYFASSTGRAVRVALAALLMWLAARAADAAPAPKTPPPKAPPDVVIFTNGDRLTGKLVKVLGGKVTFHSDIVGDVTVPWSKIKTLHAKQQYAFVEKDEHLTKKTAAGKIELGTIAVENDKVLISPPAGSAKIYPTNDKDYLIDSASFHREIQEESDLLYGWTGNITLGATLVEGTDTNQTYTGSITLIRAIPTVTWLPAGSRTSLNLKGTYGLLTQPQILVNGDLIQAASVGKTNILHGDTEYDKYISPRAFWLADANADHNFGSGLQLQQTYGLGFGLSVIKDPKETFDLKADLHFQQQQFYNGIDSGLGTPNENLIGAGLTEIWTRTLAHGVKIDQNMTLTPAFNVVRAYSGVANASLIFPVYKKLNFNLSSTDNYLGDPPIGYRRNTFQFTAGITYVLK